MEDSNIFKNIWRFNAIVIAIVGVLGILILLCVLYLMFKDISRERHRNEIVNVDPETDIKEVFRFGNIIYVTGSPTIIVPLYSDQKFSFGYSGSKSTLSTRNLLFTDLQQEKSEWLLPDNQHLIANHRLINDCQFCDKNNNTITILYQIVKTDTNKDSRLTINDQQIIAFSQPNGSLYTEIIKDVDDMLGYELINHQTIAVLFNRDQAGYTAYIDLANFQLVKEIKLPNIH